MKVGDKVFGKDVCGEFTGWIASIDDSYYYPYSVVRCKEDIGKPFRELYKEYGTYTDEVMWYKLEHLTLLKQEETK